MKDIYRLVEFTEPYDKRHPDPDKNYGIHGAELRMVYVGPKGATQFVLFTQRQLPHVLEETIVRMASKGIFLSEKDKKDLRSYTGSFQDGVNAFEEIVNYQRLVDRLSLGSEGFLFRPLPADLGYHSPKPMHEGHEPIRHIYKPMSMESDEFTPPVYGDPICCPYLEDGSPCYYDGSGLNAIRVYDLLLNSGPQAVWETLEEYYKDLFEKPFAWESGKII